MNIALPIDPVDTAEVDRITTQTLAPMVREIDAGAYPEAVMRAFGGAGAYGSHVDAPDDSIDVMRAIAAMSRAGEVCTSTAFCMWCQDALAWYIYSSDNEHLKTTLGPRVASGEVLGGTGLSNPMKAVNGIEPMRLKAERVEGGYRVKGVLPWVSNITEDSYFGVIFDAPTEGSKTPKKVMAVAFGGWDGVKLVLDHDFVAMGGTATCQVQFRDAFIPDDHILADPAEAFIKRIRGGFVLMQCGMASGMVQSCIDLMDQVQAPLGHVNRYLEKQPDDFRTELAALVAEITELARTPYDPSNAYFRRVLTARLKGGEMAVEAAHYAMLHCGARGYVSQGAAQRRLREAYFVAIVTPATKQLRKMLADLPA
jgi:hypothetical protein